MGAFVTSFFVKLRFEKIIQFYLNALVVKSLLNLCQVLWESHFLLLKFVFQSQTFMQNMAMMFWQLAIQSGLLYSLVRLLWSLYKVYLTDN